MEKFKVRCIDHQTGMEYSQVFVAENESAARMKAANEGHTLAVGFSEPTPVAGVGSDQLLREILEEQRKARAYIEKRMLTQWRLIFALYAAVILPVFIVLVAVLLAGGIDHLMESSRNRPSAPSPRVKALPSEIPQTPADQNVTDEN